MRSARWLWREAAREQKAAVEEGKAAFKECKVAIEEVEAAVEEGKAAVRIARRLWGKAAAEERKGSRRRL